MGDTSAAFKPGLKVGTWLNSSGDGGLGFPHSLHHAFQLFGGGLRRHLRRFDDGVVGVVDPETQVTLYSSPGRARAGAFDLRAEHGLQGSVSEHDSVEGQRPGDGVLLRKLHEGEPRRLSLISGHPHELHAPHLPEELEQLLRSGGLETGGTGYAFNGLTSNTGALTSTAGASTPPPQI